MAEETYTPPAKLFDLHSHWGTERGYALRTPEELALQHNTWRSTAKFVTEEEQADEFRRNNVRAILDLRFTKSVPIEQAREAHDYMMDVQRRYSDVIFGNWLQLDPRLGYATFKELDRCRSQSKGFIGLVASGTGIGIPADDPIYDFFYSYCIEAKIPVLMVVGHTGAGQGLPGGLGMKLDYSHPRHVDEVARRYPDLKIIAARPAWPWQDDMISVLLHKPNVMYELHGWSPKYLSDSLKKEIRSRLKDRVMFGADYPLLSYQRLVTDWRNLGYTDEILDRVFYKNAEAYFSALQQH